MLAGMSKVKFSRFLAYSAAGAVGPALLVGFLDYHFGRDLPAPEHHLGIATLIGVGACSALVQCFSYPSAA